MSAFPGSPRLMKGAIIGVDKFNPLASVVVFQYNPDTLTRRVQANTGQVDSPTAPRVEPMRFNGPPRETITLTMEIDLADQLERGDAGAALLGLYPTLSSLEMLLYPKAADMILNYALSRAGVLSVVPHDAPLTLFVWGLKRVVPVRITGLSITEQAFDPDLNPIQAKVELSMSVLTYQDLGLASPGGALFMAHQVAKEVMATLGGVGALSGGVSVAGSFSIG